MTNLLGLIALLFFPILIVAATVWGIIILIKTIIAIVRKVINDNKQYLLKKMLNNHDITKFVYNKYSKEL